MSNKKFDGMTDDEILKFVKGDDVKDELESMTTCDKVTMTPTSVDTLRSYGNGVVVELPPFGEGQPFIARLRRPSLMYLSKVGKIPNELLGKAAKLFNQGGAALDDGSSSALGDAYDIVRVVVDSALVSPTLEEIEGAGLILSDDQMMAIFSYTQEGVRALSRFRD